MSWNMTLDSITNNVYTRDKEQGVKMFKVFYMDNHDNKIYYHDEFETEEEAIRETELLGNFNIHAWYSYE